MSFNPAYKTFYFYIICEFYQGHVVGGALTSGLHGHQDTPVSGQYQESATSMHGQTSQNPCQFEFEQFVQCAQNQHDITFCKGFNEVLKQCKMEHGKY